MENNIIKLDDFRPHSNAKITCTRCDKTFISTFPTSCTKIEKPCCGKWITTDTFEELNE